MNHRCRLTKIFAFESAHQLPHHLGKCSRLHGHSYKLEVEIAGTPQPDRGEPDDGMVLDLDALTKVVNERVIQSLDHTFLNDVLCVTPTVENLAAFIWDTMSSTELAELLCSIRVWETAKAYAEIRRNDVDGARTPVHPGTLGNP